MNSGYVIVGVAAMVIGGLFAGVAWTHIQPFREDASSAAAVDAVVLSSSVVESSNAEGQTVYEPAVSYRYTYDGTEYTSDSVFPGDVNPVSDQSRARDIVERYQPDETVTAYVNTEDPSSAFLIDESVPLWYWGGPVIGALLLLYGLYSIVLGIRGVEPSAEMA